MRGKLIGLAASLLLVLNIFVSPTASAADFTISGKLMLAYPSAPYEANYIVNTPQGVRYYFRLTKAFYRDWVGKDVYFHVTGSVNSYTVQSSGLGTRNNTIPATGPVTFWMLLAATFAGAGITILRIKKSGFQISKATT